MDNKIFTINNLQKSRRSRELETINLSSTGQEIVHYQLPIDRFHCHATKK